MVIGVPQGASVPAAGGKVDQHPDLGGRHHPEEHQRLPLQEELQVLQTESHHHPESHPRTPGQVQRAGRAGRRGLAGYAIKLHVGGVRAISKDNHLRESTMLTDVIFMERVQLFSRNTRHLFNGKMA